MPLAMSWANAANPDPFLFLRRTRPHAMRLERGDVHLAIIPEGNERFNSHLLYPIYICGH